MTDHIAEHCPELTDLDVQAISDLSKINFMGASYAHAQCLNAQETIRRMQLQAEWTIGPTAEMIQKVVNEIKANEPDTFAGQWIHSY